MLTSITLSSERLKAVAIVPDQHPQDPELIRHVCTANQLCELEVHVPGAHQGRGPKLLVKYSSSTCTIVAPSTRRSCHPNRPVGNVAH